MTARLAIWGWAAGFLLAAAGCASVPRTGGSGAGGAYVVRGETYVPLRSARGFREEGIASWYGFKHAGRRTASGERFNPNRLTAAHKLLPFHSSVKVTNLENGRTVVVRINDRGPFIPGRVLDLSHAAARRIGILKRGLARVLVEGPPP